jgi:hypothetical protein
MLPLAHVMSSGALIADLTHHMWCLGIKSFHDEGIYDVEGQFLCLDRR